MGTKTFGVTVAPAVVDLQISDQPSSPPPASPAQTPQCDFASRRRRHRGLRVRRRAGLCPRAPGKRPRRRAAEQCDELAPSHHSITSSARASSVGGTSMPSALAVLRLMISSNFVGCMTGRSAGLAPLKYQAGIDAQSGDNASGNGCYHSSSNHPPRRIRVPIVNRGNCVTRR